MTKVAVVTGASSGLGLASAKALGRDGYTLVASSRDIGRTRAELEASGAPAVRVVAGDLAEPGTTDAILAAVAPFGRVDALLLNHGGPPVRRFLDIDDETWLASFRLMVLGPLRLFRSLVPLLQHANPARVVAITSFTVKAPYAGIALSNSLRAALTNALKTAALELGREGFLINTVAPGYIATARTVEFDAAYASQQRVPVEEITARTTATIPVGRYGEPTDVAELVAFLLGDRNRYITGQQFLVDGGLVTAQ